MFSIENLDKQKNQNKNNKEEQKENYTQRKLLLTFWCIFVRFI